MMRGKNWPIINLPGIREPEQSLLLELGIDTTFKLLKITQKTAKKEKLAQYLVSGLPYLNKLIALADLSRIEGVGCEYCGLLLHGGVLSVDQLSRMSVARVHQNILRLQVSTIQRRDLCPRIEQIQSWITIAQRLI